MSEFEIEQLVLFATNVVFVTTLGWYLITNLQWYDYKIERVILKHHKFSWHFIYFLIPLLAYYLTDKFFVIFFIFAVLPSIVLWHKRLDKKLVLTWRVKRFLLLLVSLTLFGDLLCLVKEGCKHFGVLLPLAITYLGSMAIEKYLFMIYKKEAERKLAANKKLKVIAITGSYGKTSMKNFIAQILRRKFSVYATPRSVNTLGGIIRDINENLASDCDYYICEAGAREQGDILDIAQLLNPHIVVVGKIGPQHMEYFKTLDNIRATKLELMHSNRLERAFVHTSVTDEPHEKVTHFSDVDDIEATLEGTTFTLEGRSYKTEVLGSFQTININAAILVAKELGLKDDEIIRAVESLEPVEHRLQRIDAGGKIILDDGYNGNIDGMLEGIRLCATHKGNKVIVTPGLVEAEEALNLQLIDAINSVFDLVIVTGTLNAKLFQDNLKVKQFFHLENKASLEIMLAEKTHAGDIILFANDAPNFI